jgi:phosphoribosylformimino-5-aminoimidazole carboxamide ribotide isomerase
MTLLFKGATMQIIPVLDLKAGQAVHAVRGRREQYAPVQGVLGSGEDPVALALAYRDRLGCQSCYVADLDAIAGRAGHRAILGTLAAAGMTLWVDAGVSTPEAAEALLDLGVSKIIIGSETLPAGDQLRVLTTQLPPQTLVLSVDLLAGVLRAPSGIETPRQLVTLAADAGLNEVILLDLARVGAEAGPPLALLDALQPHFPNLAFYAGGGVRHRADLAVLTQAGAAGALIATAFHRAALTAVDVQNYQS